MLKHRIMSGVIIGAALVVAAFWTPPVGILLVLLAICAVAMWEFYKLLDASGIPHFKFLGILGGLSLITATWISLRMSEGTPCDIDWLILFLVTMAVFIRQFPQKNNPRPLMTIASTLLGVLYVAFLFNFFTKLLMAWGDSQGRWLAIYLIVVVKFTDIGAYFSGRWLGRHKLFPRISPKKTWEGVVGGVATALVVSVLFYLLMRGRVQSIHMTLVDALVLGVLLSVSGIVGDLTESLFKRAAGIKDSGRIIMGMGGVLDVIDSLLFAAPALYAYARFFME